MDVDYDPAKNEKNIRERGLSFERVREFDFGTAGLKMVVRNAELRWTAVGYLDGVLHSKAGCDAQYQLSQCGTKGASSI